MCFQNVWFAHLPVWTKITRGKRRGNSVSRMRGKHTLFHFTVNNTFSRGTINRLEVLFTAWKCCLRLGCSFCKIWCFFLIMWRTLKVVCSHCILIPQGSTGSSTFVSNESPYISHYNSKVSASNSIYFGSYSRKCNYLWYTNFDFHMYFHKSLIPSVTYLFLPQERK